MASGLCSAVQKTAFELMPLAMTAALFALALPGYAQHHPVYTGKVVRVLDGRTLEIRVRSRDLPADTMATVWLWGIDLGKDKKQEKAAKKLLTKLALDRNVHVDVYGKGGWVRTEGSRTSLNAALVSAGLARRWKPSGIRDFEHHERDLENAEKEAKRKKLGIWKSAARESKMGEATVNAISMNHVARVPTSRDSETAALGPRITGNRWGCFPDWFLRAGTYLPSEVSS